jgi:hypothetical protein
MVAERMAVEGIDARQIEAFNKGYLDAPSNFTLGIEGRSIWEGRGLGNLAKVGPWSLGGQAMDKPTRDFSVQIGSWREVGDALGVVGADDRIEPIEAAMVGLALLRHRGHHAYLRSERRGVARPRRNGARRCRPGPDHRRQGTG